MLTVLEQPALPVELKTTLELATDFAKVDGACNAGGPAGVQPPAAAVDIQAGD